MSKFVPAIFSKDSSSCFRSQLLAATAAALVLALGAPKVALADFDQASNDQMTSPSDAGTHRYELNRSESLLMMNISVADSISDKANYLHLENVFSGQTYRVKLRNGTHLLKVEAGVYRADFARLNMRLFSEKSLDGAAIETPENTELTLMPQTANFVGSWNFSDTGRYGELSISPEHNPAIAIAQRYPVISKYELHATQDGSTRLVTKSWPLEVRELLSTL